MKEKSSSLKKIRPSRIYKQKSKDWIKRHKTSTPNSPISRRESNSKKAPTKNS
jgi:hypothetical protein